MKHDRELELVRRYIEGAATAEETSALENALRADPDFRRQFLRYTHLDAALVRSRRGATNASLMAAALKEVEPSPWARWRAPLAAAAAVALAALAWWAWPALDGRVFASVVQSEGAQFAPGSFAPGDGTSLRNERLRLDHGPLLLVTPRGVRVELNGPAELAFESAERLRVFRGRLSVDVGPRGKGFVVATEQTQVVDLGTKFGVDVADSAHTDVVVFQGKVDLFERQSARQPSSALAHLVEGEAVRVDQRTQMSRIVNVTSSREAGDWHTREDAPGGIIASVRDNLRDPSARNYYRIVAGGLQEDARAFVGQRHEWNGLDASGLPAELVGADLVQTFINDRLKTALEITVTLARPGVVYVLTDSRVEPPSWLTEGFTNTGERIGLENAPTLESGRTTQKGPGAGNMVPFAVWKCHLPRGGSVTLGPPRESPDQRLHWMYGIAAKPL